MSLGGGALGSANGGLGDFFNQSYDNAFGSSPTDFTSGVAGNLSGGLSGNTTNALNSIGGVLGNVASGILGYNSAGAGNSALQAGYNNATNYQNTGYNAEQANLATNQQYAQNAISNANTTGTNAINTNVANAASAQQPYLGLGSDATSAYENALGIGANTGQAGYGSLNPDFNTQNFNLYKDPSYQFRLQQGSDALARFNAAQGKYFSGQDLKQGANYNQQAASQEFQNAYNRYLNNINTRTGQLQSGINTGAGAANNLSSIYGNAGTNLANLNLGTAGLANTNAQDFTNLYSQNATNNANQLGSYAVGAAGGNQQTINAQNGAINGALGGILGSGGSSSGGGLGSLVSGIGSVAQAVGPIAGLAALF